jgi:hypothetical protein
MTMRSKHKFLIIFSFLMMAICLGACSTFPFKPAEEVLHSRVDGLMKAKVSNEWGEIYEYYCSSYKDVMSRDKFLIRNGSRMSSAIRYEIESIEINPSGDEATVKVKSDVDIIGIEFKGIIMTQTWLKEGWDWYLYVDNKPTRSLP